MCTKQSMLSQVQSPNHATIDRPDFCELIPNNGFPPAPTLCNQLQFVQLSRHWNTMWTLLYNCTFCCCDFDISLIAGFLLPPPPAGSGPCNVVYLYHDVSQCITMHSNICCTSPRLVLDRATLFICIKCIKIYKNELQHIPICCTPHPAGCGPCLPYLLIIFFAAHCNTHIFQGTFIHCKI